MGRQHDWSDVDKKFALNCGLTPKTPEEIFPFENNIIHSTPNLFMTNKVQTHILKR